MIISVFVHLFSVLFDLLSLLSRSEREKAPEIALLRQQIRILQRTRSRSPRLSWWEKLPLALLAAKLVNGQPTLCARLSQNLLLFTPETVLRWHRELVRRRWTFRHQSAVGRPRIAEELEALIVRFERENPRWGYSKIEGELRKLGYGVGARPFAPCSNVTVSPLHPSTPDRTAPGVHSCASTNSTCWRVIFSRWKPCACKRCMCSSLSR